MKKLMGIGLLSVMWICPLHAKPSGAEIKHGKASVRNQDNSVHVKQKSKHAIIHWKDFSIAEGELAEFHLANPKGATLNRVTGTQMSKLMGTLRSNGKLYLINPNGILVGPNGIIDTAGTILSTLDLMDTTFLEGRDLWFKGDSQEGIVNLGHIQTLTGDIFLLAAKVQNDGSLEAPQGTVGLASASEIYLKPAGQERLVIKTALGDGSLENAGKIDASFVEMQIVKENPYALAINTSGTISATQVEKKGGKILLRASGGSITASGNVVAPSGDIQLHGDNVAVSGTLSVSGDESGGNILVFGNDTAALTGSLLANGSKQGGNIELSGGNVDLKGTVQSTGENAGTFLLDPYNVWLSTTSATLPTVDWSWVDVSAGSTLINTLDSGTNVTLTTTSNAGYDLTGNSLLDGDMVVYENVSWTGNGGLSLSATRDLDVDAAIVTTGTGAVTLVAGRDFALDPSLGRVQTAGGNINVTSGTVDATGKITAYTTTPGTNIFDALTGDVLLSSVGTGDITAVGSIQSTNVSFNAPTASIWIGNDSTGTLSSGGQMEFLGDNTGTLTALGAAVTISGGAGSFQAVMSKKEQLNIQSYTGDVVITGGSGNYSGIDLRSEAGVGSHTFQAAGNLRFLGGSDSGAVSIGNNGIGTAQGNVFLTAGGNLDMIAGNNSTVDIRSGGGILPDVIKVGTSGVGDLTITASNAAAILYLNMMGTNPPGTYSVANNIIATGGTGGGSNSAVHVQITNPDGLTVGYGAAGGDLVVQARDNDMGYAIFEMYTTNPVHYDINGDVQILGGSGTNGMATATLRSGGGGTHNIDGGILIRSGTAENASAYLYTGNSTVRVQDDVQVIAQNAPAQYNFGDVDTSMSQLLVSGSVSVIAGSSAGSYAATASIDGQVSFYSEVVNDVLIQGGTAPNANAYIGLFTSTNPSEQTLYVGGEVNCIGGSAENTSATIDVMTLGVPLIQSLEAGQDITFTGGTGNGAMAGIRNAGVYDPSGILVGIPVDTPGPTLNIQSLGNITCQNGTGDQAYAVMGTDGTIILPGYPDVQAVSGSVIAMAGGNINVSAPLNKNYNIGPLNENHQIVLFANRQFAPGSLWPVNTLLGVSGPSLFPLGQGALTFDTASINANTLLATNKGNISLLSAPLNSSGITPVDFVDGTLVDEALLSTNNGNIFILGFRDITINTPLNTAGNNTLVPGALYNIQIQANEALTVNQPIAIPTPNYSIGIGTGTVTNDPVTLNASVSAHASSGLVAVIDNSGPIAQTAGIVAAQTVNLSAAQGITGPSPTYNAMLISAGIVNAQNSATGNVSLLNNLAGTSATYAQATLANGTSGIFNDRSLTFLQTGGTSLRVNSASCDGDMLVGTFSGTANLSIEGDVRPGRNLMAVAYGDLNLTATGRIRGVGDVTLICDEAYPHNTGPGWFRNLSEIGGVTTEALDQNIAVYAASGPEAATLNPPVQVILGNLAADATWDAGLPNGLDSKYATSYQDGGPYHGAGFGTDYTPGNGVFGSSVIWYKYPMDPPPVPPDPPLPPFNPPYHTLAQAAFAIQGLTLQLWEMRLVRDIQFGVFWQQNSCWAYPLYRYRLPVPFKTDPLRVNDSYEKAIYALLYDI